MSEGIEPRVAEGGFAEGEHAGPYGGAEYAGTRDPEARQVEEPVGHEPSADVVEELGGDSDGEQHDAGDPDEDDEDE